MLKNVNREAARRGGLPLTSVILASLALLVFAGCENESRMSKPAYAKKVRTEWAGVRAAFLAAVGRPGERPSARTLAERVSRVQQALRKAADDLDMVEPPKDVEEPHEEFIEGLRGYADDIEPVRKKLLAGDKLALIRFNRLTSENESVKRIGEAAEEMLKRGYDVGFEPD